MARKQTGKKKAPAKRPSGAPTRAERPSSLLNTRIVYCGDCIDQLRKLPDDCVDLIYIDPPFNSNRNYEVFWGETKEKRAFEDRHASTAAYIDYMRPRCVQLARVLKKTGSFYYHCDWHASHYVKVMLDQIFGANAFLNEIIWCYNVGGKSKKQWARKHDTIFFYAKGKKWFFDGAAVGIKRETGTKSFGGKIGTDAEGRKYQDKLVKATGKYYRYYLDEPKIPEDWWVGINSLQSQSAERLGYPTQKPQALLDRIIRASSRPNDIVLDAFCGCGTALVAAEECGRQWIGIDISPTACRVMGKRLRDVCRLREDEDLWRAGHGFVVRDLPWTEEKLRQIPPFEFENWAVIALGGIPNKTQVGDMGIDGRIFPVAATPKKAAVAKGETPAFEQFLDHWYPIQVKQKQKVGRPDIDSFEAVMTREDRTKGFFVAFDYTKDALREIDAFFRKSGKAIIALTVREILDEEIARKLA